MKDLATPGNAHLLLVDELLEADPTAAAEVLAQAIRLDPYNEDLYRNAIRTLLCRLTIALVDRDAEPEDETLELAQRLRNGLDHP